MSSASSAEQSLELRAATLKPRPLSLKGYARRAVRSTAVVFGVLVLWETLPRTKVIEPAFLPPLSEVLSTGWLLIQTGELFRHLSASLVRSLSGFFLAILSAVPIGLLMGWYRWISETLSPILEVLRNTAALALLPVFILFLGIGETSKIALIVYACSWPILLNTLGGVRNVDPLLIKSARTMGLTPVQLFQKVILPAAIPQIFVGIRLAGATSLIVLIAAEMIGAKAGLGYLIMYSQYNFQIPHMYLGILTSTVTGLLFNEILKYIEKRLTSWKPVNEAAA